MADFMWGMKMTLVGMDTVFALLALLMGVLVLIGRLDAEPRPAVEEAPEPEPEPQLLASEADRVTTEAPSPLVELLTGNLTVAQATAVAVAVVTHAEVRRREAAPVMRTFAPGSQIHTSRWVAVGRASQTQPWNRR